MVVSSMPSRSASEVALRQAVDRALSGYRRHSEAVSIQAVAEKVRLSQPGTWPMTELLSLIGTRAITGGYNVRFDARSGDIAIG